MEFLVQLVRMEILAVSKSPVSTGLEDGRGLIETDLFSSIPKLPHFSSQLLTWKRRKKKGASFVENHGRPRSAKLTKKTPQVICLIGASPLGYCKFDWGGGESSWRKG